MTEVNLGHCASFGSLAKSYSMVSLSYDCVSLRVCSLTPVVLLLVPSP